MNWILLPLSPHPHVILHAGLARSCRIHFFNKRRKTYSLGRRRPPGRMSGVRKCFSMALTHRLRRSPLSRRARVIFWMMDSATSPFGFAQNDSIAGGVQVSYLNKGMVQSCSCGADSTHLTLPIGTPQANRG